MHLMKPQWPILAVSGCELQWGEDLCPEMEGQPLEISTRDQADCSCAFQAVTF